MPRFSRLRALLEALCPGAPLRRAALGAALLPAMPAMPADINEAALKSAFLYNFALYTEWPSLPNVYEICVAGHDDLGAVLDGLTQRVISGRAIVVRRMQSGDRVDVPQSCTVLFIAASEKERGKRWLDAIKNRSVLTVGDVGLGGEATPMIQLAGDQGKLVFSASLSRAKAVGLTLSARMLRIARAVD